MGAFWRTRSFFFFLFSTVVLETCGIKVVENSELRTSESNIGHLGFLLLSSCCIGIFFEVVKLDLKITECMVACSCGYFLYFGESWDKGFCVCSEDYKTC